MNLEIVLNLEGPKMDKVWQDSAIHNLHKVASHCTITAVRFLMDLNWLNYTGTLGCSKFGGAPPPYIS